MSSSPPIHFKFIRPTLTKRFSLFAGTQQDYHTLISKLKSLSGSNFRYLEVQDVDGDWIRVDTSDEWEYMKSLLLQHNENAAIQVRDGHEWQQHEEKKQSATASSGPQETKTSSGASSSTSSSSSAASGINAQDIARDVVASVLPTLVGVVKNNPQLLSTVVSTVGTIGTQGSQLLQSNIIPSLVGMASYASGSKSNTSQQQQSHSQQQNSNSSNNSATPEAMLSSFLSQLFVSAAGNGASSSSSSNTSANNRSNTSSSSSNSTNFAPTLSQIFTPEHIQQGLLMGESFMRNLQQTYVNPQPKTDSASSSDSSVSSATTTDNKSSSSTTTSAPQQSASVAPSAPPQYPSSPLTTSTTSSPVPEVQVDENNVALLVSMGFLDRDQNRRALKKWHNNVNRAVQQLLNEPYF